MDRPKVTIEELEEAREWLREHDVMVQISRVEVHMGEKRVSPMHGQYSPNEGAMTLSAIVAINALEEDSGATLDKVVDAMILSAGRGTRRIHDSME